MCQGCHGKTELNFNPRVKKERWGNFVCPSCGRKKNKTEE